MLEDIIESHLSVKDFVSQVKNKKNGIRLMGFGHRVYKNFDPRARIIRAVCEDVLSRLNIDDPMLEIAKELEATALEDDYFIQRKLYPNVDFYSGLIYQAMGFSPAMFPVLFAIGRTAGWLAQWEELVSDSTRKIARPRQIYVGEAERDYVSIAAR